MREFTTARGHDFLCVLFHPCLHYTANPLKWDVFKQGHAQSELIRKMVIYGVIHLLNCSRRIFIAILLFGLKYKLRQHKSQLVLHLLRLLLLKDMV
jgi:hypothetical protein